MAVCVSIAPISSYVVGTQGNEDSYIMEVVLIHMHLPQGKGAEAAEENVSFAGKGSVWLSVLCSFHFK